MQEYSLQSTTGLKIALQIHSESAQKGNNVLKFCKFQKSLRNCPFFSNTTANTDFSKYRLQEKCFLWMFWNSYEFARKRSIMKSFDQLNSSKNLFQGMLEKLLLRKFWKIIRKMSLVESLLKNLSCPIHPPITKRKRTPPQIFPLFALRILKLVGKRLWWNHI